MHRKEKSQLVGETRSKFMVVERSLDCESRLWGMLAGGHSRGRKRRAEVWRWTHRSVWMLGKQELEPSARRQAREAEYMLRRSGQRRSSDGFGRQDKPAMLSDLENTRPNISYGCKGKTGWQNRRERPAG